MAVKLEIIGDYSASASASIRAAIKDVQILGRESDVVAKEIVGNSADQRIALEKLAASFTAVAATAEKGSAQQVAAAKLAADAQKQLGVAVAASSAESARFSGATRTAESDLGRLTRGGLAGSGVMSGFGKSVAYASASFIGGAGLIEVIKVGIDDAEKYDATLRSLDVAIRNTGGSVAAYRGEVNTLAVAGAKLGFTNMDVLSGLRTLTLVTGNATDAVQYMGLAEDISRAKGVSLTATSTAVGKAIDGKTTALQRYGIVVAKGEPILEALTQAEHRYAGQALANTTVTQKLSATVTDLETKIGQALMPEVKDISVAIEGWISKSKNQKKITDDVKTAVADAVTVFKDAKAIIHDVDSVTGSFTHTLEILLGLKVASVLSGWGNMFYKVAGGEVAASAAAKGLMGWLTGLARIGPIIIPVGLAYFTEKYGAHNEIQAAGAGGIDATLGPGISKDQTVTVNGKQYPIGTSDAINALRGAGFKGSLGNAAQEAAAAKSLGGGTSLTGSNLSSILAAIKAGGSASVGSVPTVHVPTLPSSFNGGPGGAPAGSGGKSKKAPAYKIPDALEAAIRGALQKFGDHVSKQHLATLDGLLKREESLLKAHGEDAKAQSVANEITKANKKFSTALANQQAKAAKASISKIEQRTVGPEQVLKLAQAAGQPASVILADQQGLLAAYQSEATALKRKMAASTGKAKADYAAALSKIRSGVSSASDAVAASLQSLAQTAQSNLTSLLGSIEAAADQQLGAQFFQGTLSPLEQQLAAMQQADQLQSLQDTLAAATTPAEKAAAQRQIDEFNLSIAAQKQRTEMDREYAQAEYNLNAGIDRLSRNVGDGASIQGDLNKLLGQYGIQLSDLSDPGGNGLMTQLQASVVDTTTAFKNLMTFLDGISGASSSTSSGSGGSQGLGPIFTAGGGRIPVRGRIQAFADGGWTGSTTGGGFPAVLHPNEYVVPQRGALVLRGGSGDGVTLNVNVSGAVPADTKRLARQLAGDIRDELVKIGRREPTIFSGQGVTP